MNKDRILKYSILIGPILLFLVVFWTLEGVFNLTTDSVRGVHLPRYANIEEDTPPLFEKKDTTSVLTSNKVVEITKNK